MMKTIIIMASAVALIASAPAFAGDKKEAFVIKGKVVEDGKPQDGAEVHVRALDRKAPDIALGPNDILYIPDSRRARTTASVIEKMIGFDQTAPTRVLALTGTAAKQVVVVSFKTGELTAIAYDPRSPADRALVAHLRGEERAYGATTLYVEAQTKTDLTGAVLEWTDVFIKEAGKPPRNLSRCDGVDCAEPALSADGSTAAFVKAAQ